MSNVKEFYLKGLSNEDKNKHKKYIINRRKSAREGKYLTKKPELKSYKHRKSQKDSSVAVFFVRFIVALGKTIAAKDVFDTTGAVFAGPDIQFIPERVVLIAQYNTILEYGHLSSLKKTSPAVTMVLMFIAHSNAVSDSVTFSLVFN